VIGSLTADRVNAVLAPKATAAWHLHELTRHLDLEGFVLFSPAAAVLGAEQQGHYAAANAFLDGLAAARRAEGLPATSLAWGLRATGHLDNGERAGMTALSAEKGLALLDLAAGRDEALLVAARLDVAGGHGRRTAAAEAGGVDGPGALRERLARLAGPERDRMLLDLVRAHVAAVLGHISAKTVEPGRAFKDLGFDSLTAVEFRNRLNAATGLQLPATLIFDYPTPDALAEYLWAEEFQDEAATTHLLDEFDRLESLLSAVSPDEITRTKIITRLQSFLSKWSNGGTSPASENVAEKIESATDDEIFEFIHKEFGRS
jgi:acyl carrier protein